MAKGEKKSKKRVMKAPEKPKRIRVLWVENGKKRFIWREVGE